MDYEKLVSKLAITQRKAQAVVDQYLSPNLSQVLVIDEMSLLFSSRDEIEKFTEWANQNVPSIGEVPKSTLYSLTGPGEFDVNFRFFQTPFWTGARSGLVGFVGTRWRIEAMQILDGRAPLHEHYLKNFDSPCAMHASFKVPTVYEYRKVQAVLDACTSEGMEAEYRNEYGMFCYYSLGGDGVPYIKPRVNLRD